MFNKSFLCSLLVFIILICGVLASSNFDLEVKDFDSKGEQNSYVSIKLKVTNLESTPATKRVECGIYKASSVKSWYPSFLGISIGEVQNIDNCISTETFVSTVALYLDKWTSKIVSFEVKVPNYEVGDGYVWHCSAFDKCYSEVASSTQDVGQSDYLVKDFKIVSGDAFSVECYIDSDCGRKEECTRNVCVEQKIIPSVDVVLDCVVDSDCGRNEYCTRNVCVAKEPSFDSCSLDSDCVVGEVCGNRNICVLDTNNDFKFIIFSVVGLLFVIVLLFGLVRFFKK